jgi:tRNA (guanine-N7-)-methyltransferase
MNISSSILDITEYYLPLDLSEIFGNEKKLALEVGFGDGAFLVETARSNLELNFVGIEIKEKRLKKAVKRIEKEKLENVKLLIMDVRIAIEEVFSLNTFNEIYINFPDPWPKERHKKHRIIDPDFLKELSRIMKPEAVLEIASDHEEYISYILTTLDETENFECSLPPPGYVNSLPDRPTTKYEKEFREEGKKIYYLKFLRTV